MDGIFGVGLPEMLIIALVMFVIGGPENTAKWAREAGRIVRKVRKMWDDMMAEVEQELGPDGKEIMDATRELGRSARELRSVSSPTRLMSETARLLDEPTTSAPPSAAKPATADKVAAPSSNGTSSGESTSSDDSKYRAWLPPKGE
jgi:sec-independent protein translocase protein TatB